MTREHDQSLERNCPPAKSEGPLVLTEKEAGPATSRILFVVPESAVDPAMRFHGSTKDILSHEQYFVDRGISMEKLVVPRGEEKVLNILKRKSLENYAGVFIDIPKTYPLTIRYIKETFPTLPVIFRSANAELFHRLDWARAEPSWSEKKNLLKLAFRGWLGDRACARFADWVMPISDHDARYWNRFQGRAKIVSLPYFIPRDLIPPGVKSSEKENFCVGLGALLSNPLIEDAHRNLSRLVSRLKGRCPEWRFAVNGKLSATFKGTDRLQSLGTLSDPFVVLRRARAVAILSDYGRGFKTKILEAILMKAYVLVTPTLFKRLPEAVRPFCLKVSPSSVKEFVGALERSRHPFPDTDVNDLLQSGAYAALDSVFGLLNPAREGVSGDAVPFPQEGSCPTK